MTEERILQKKVVNCAVILRECAPAIVYVCIREEASGGGEEDNREEHVCQSSQFGLQENNEDRRFHKCCVTHTLSPHFYCRSCQKHIIRELLPDLYSAESINTITASKSEKGYRNVI